MVDGGGSGRGDRIGLGVEFVIFDALDADRLKRSQAYVQGDFGSLDSVLADLVKNLRGEVKSGGGSSDGAELLGVYGLIAVAVGGGCLLYTSRCV